MEDAQQDRLAQLSAEMAWLRRLARALLKTGDPDDLAHDTWIAASARPPDDDRPLRPWLTRVALNVVRMQARSRKRQDAREEASASLAGAVATPAELVEKVELQRLVAGEVLALAEPYRSTVLLHYFEELSCAQIARRLGLPEATVRGRLKVALDQLRTRLGRGGRGSRLAALAPLAGIQGPSRTAPLAVGAIAMKKLVAIVVVIILGVVLWRARPDSPDEASDRSGAIAHSGARGAHATPIAGIAPWMTARAIAPRRIAGRVDGASGGMRGATVRLALQPRPGVLLPIGERLTDAGGTFDFGAQPAATFVVSAEAPQYSGATITISVADPRAKPDALVLTLGACTLRLSGEVRDAARGPIANARLTADGLAGTDSDDHGRYTLCLHSRQPMVRIEADGYGTVETILRINGALRSDFVLVPEGVVVGQVVTREGRPVTGARVVAAPDPVESGNYLAPRWALTDDGGVFHLAGLAPGRYRVTATGDGVATAAPVEATVRAGAAAFNTILVVGGAAHIRGHVVMAGTPVAGVRVIATRGGEWIADAAYSQPDGSFELTGVPFGTASLETWPHHAASAAALAVDRQAIDDVTLEVTKLATVRGRVTRHGEAVAGAEVFTSLSTSTMTDAQGTYVLEGLRAGELHVSAGHSGHKAYGDEVVTLQPGDDKTLDIELAFAGEAQGTVVDEHGAPVASVYVQLTSDDGDLGEAMTDDQGRFDCMTLAGGLYRIKVLAGAGVGRTFPPPAGEEFPTIEVPADGVVTGIRIAIANSRVHIRGVVKRDGAPVADAYVAVATRLQSLARSGAVMTDADGAFELVDLAPGNYALRAHAADGSEGFARDIEGGAENVVIELVAPGAIDGELVGFTTAPAVELALLSTNLRVTVSALVDGTRFSQRGLRPGRYAVQARSGGEVASAEVEVRPGETAHVALRPGGAGMLEGTAWELGTTRPIAGMRCEAKSSLAGPTADPAMQATTDDTGHFAMRAPAGKVHVICRSDDVTLSIAGNDVDVAANGAASTVVRAVRRTFGMVRGNAGFMLTPMTLPLTLTRVAPKGPAGSQGARDGDHLVSIDGIVLDGVLPLGAMWLVMNHRPGTTLELGLDRGGAPLTIKIPVGAEPK